MTLTLTVLRCPDGVPLETRHVAGGDFTIGRDPRNDWVLPDPDRFLSKRHCVVSRTATGWQILDTSTNGCFLNHEIEPIRGNPRGLRDGDRILLGSYEIEVSLRMGQEAAMAITLPQPGPADAATFADDRLVGDPFGPRLLDPLNLTTSTGASLPEHYDPLAVEPELGADPVLQDQVFLEAAYRPPHSYVDLLPDDWNEDDAPVTSPAPPAPPAPVPTAEADADAAIAAFLRGAGITLTPGTSLANSAADTLQALGAAFRAMVHGLRRITIARASSKGAFRIEQTVIPPSGNNPLKFAANDEDALAALLNIGRRSDLTPEAAVADALLDTRLHEVAMMTAMRDAVLDLLAQYDPRRLLETRDGKRSGSIPVLRKARAWTQFEALHQKILAAFTDDFDSVFGKAFARAYERSMAEALALHEREAALKTNRLG